MLYPTTPQPQADAPAADGNPTSDERVKQFRLTTSLLGQRLAGLLAAAPVSLKVIGLIRTTLLPEAGLAHEAEVLFGGLLHRTSKPRESDPRFEFYRGVRKLLLDAARVDESVDVLDAMSKYQSKRFADGRPFSTVLSDPTGAAGLLSELDSPFAQIAAEVLLRAGGDYAKLVPASLLPKLEPTDKLTRLLKGTTDETETVELLTQAARLGDPRLATVVVPRLAVYWPAAVRHAARDALKYMGVLETFNAIEELARQNDPALDAVLDGLAVLGPREDLVELLSRVAEFAAGAVRDKAAALRDHKRLGLNFPVLTKKFKDARSPLEFERALGAGRFTDSYLARDAFLHMSVVVRVLRNEFARIPSIRQQFLAVSRQSVPLAHTGLVRTQQVGSLPGGDVLFVVRGYVDGPTLRSVLAEPSPAAPGPHFRPIQAVEILRQFLNALDMLAESGLFHGDVHPSNIFLTLGNRVVLGDRAIVARPLAKATADQSDTDRYFAPEVFKGEPTGPAADLYSLGCVAHELFYGWPPFLTREPVETGSAESALQRKLGPDVGAFLTQLLNRDPAARGTAAAALTALDAFRFTDTDSEKK